MSGQDSCLASHVLTNVIVVLERVFKYMNARQLNTCARVCRTWKEQVNREKEDREQMRWTYFTFDADDVNLCWDSVQHFIMESNFEPSMVLVFCTSALWSLTVDRGGRRKKKRKQKFVKFCSPDVVIPCLPCNCGFQVVVTGGVVGTDESMKTVENDIDTEALTLLMLGNFPGAEFLFFSTSRDNCNELAKFWCGQCNFKPGFLNPLHDMDVKMLNLYCPPSGIDQEVGYSLFKMFDWPLIAGGFVQEKSLRDSKGHFHSTEISCIVSGWAICGADVKVASILIKNEVQTEQEVEEAIKQLKDFDIPMKNTFGLMYACIGRGTHMYDKDNVESSIFRKHFPHTPLFGFFGDGEIGCVYPPSDPYFRKDRGSGVCLSSSCDRNGEISRSHSLKIEGVETRQMELMHKMKHPPKLLHAYTTVICLVSLP